MGPKAPQGDQPTGQDAAFSTPSAGQPMVLGAEAVAILLATNRREGEAAAAAQTAAMQAMIVQNASAY